LSHKDAIKHEKGEPPRFSDNPQVPPSKEFGQNPKDPPEFPTTVHLWVCCSLNSTLPSFAVALIVIIQQNTGKKVFILYGLLSKLNMLKTQRKKPL
jgi:hypothetical protein